MQRLTYALDLRDDPTLIAEYETWHRAEGIWPSVIESLRASGMANLEIYRTGNRLFMVIDAPDDFSMEDQAGANAANAQLQAWEQLMSTFQQPLPWAAPGQKWIPMMKIFSLAAIIDTDRRQND